MIIISWSEWRRAQGKPCPQPWRLLSAHIVVFCCLVAWLRSCYTFASSEDFVAFVIVASQDWDYRFWGDFSLQDAWSNNAQFEWKVGIMIWILGPGSRSREVKVGWGLDWHFRWIFKGLRVFLMEALNIISKYLNGGKIHPGSMCLELADIIIKTY